MVRDGREGYDFRYDASAPSLPPPPPPPPLLNMNTRYSLSSPDDVREISGTPPATCFFTQDSRELGFRLFFFKMLLSLRRWPHFRASALSESCTRCSAGVFGPSE